jgi:hypothetical protein
MDEAGRHHALRWRKEAMTTPWRSVRLEPARSIERLSSLDAMAGGPALRRLLVFACISQARVPHPSRTLRRVGTTDAYTAGFVRKDKTCIGSIAAHPCKKRKDGAPTVWVWEGKTSRSRKSGPPASLIRSFPSYRFSLFYF